MAKPFQICAANRTNEKGKSYTNAPVEINGLLWANLELNTEGNYGFKEDRFTLKIKFATGVIDTAGHKWLVGSFENGEQLFDIKAQVANGTKEDGKPKYEASPKEEELKQKWEADGKLCAILCDDVPQLVYFVEDCAKDKLVFCDEGYEVFLKLNPDRELLKKVNQEIIDEKPDNPSPQRKKNQLHKQFLAENSWFYYAWDEETIISCLEESSLAIESIEDCIEGHEIVLDEEGYLTKFSLPWAAPEVKATQGKKSWGGSSGQSRKESLKDAKEFAFAELGVSSWDELIQKFGKEICPIKAELVISFASGVNWTNRFYQPQGTELQYEEAKPKYLVEVPKIDSNNGHQPEPTVGKQKRKSKGQSSPEAVVPKVEVETLTTEEDEETTNEESTLETGDDSWASKIEALKAFEPKYLIPKELDEIELINRGEEWCEQYYTLITGTLITPKGSIGFTDRSSTSFVKSKFSKFPHSMNVNELKKVISSEGVFIPSEVEAI